MNHWEERNVNRDIIYEKKINDPLDKRHEESTSLSKFDPEFGERKITAILALIESDRKYVKMCTVVPYLAIIT